MRSRDLAEIDSKPLALAWIASAERALARPDDPLTASALRVNFAFDRLAPAEHEATRKHIAASYGEIRAALGRSGRVFRDVTEVEARRACRVAPGRGVPPAYSIFGGHVYFAPNFADFGPKCRAAMLIHECVHLFDGRSGEPQIHVSEFAPEFDAIPPDEQVHNASAYASFAAQVHHRALEWPREARYGAGRPRE